MNILDVTTINILNIEYCVLMLVKVVVFVSKSSTYLLVKLIVFVKAVLGKVVLLKPRV